MNQKQKREIRKELEERMNNADCTYAFAYGCPFCSYLDCKECEAYRKTLKVVERRK